MSELLNKLSRKFEPQIQTCEQLEQKLDAKIAFLKKNKEDIAKKRVAIASGYNDAVGDLRQQAEVLRKENRERLKRRVLAELKALGV